MPLQADVRRKSERKLQAMNFPSSRYDKISSCPSCLVLSGLILVMRLLVAYWNPIFLCISCGRVGAPFLDFWGSEDLLLGLCSAWWVPVRFPSGRHVFVGRLTVLS